MVKLVIKGSHALYSSRRGYSQTFLPMYRVFPYIPILFICFRKDEVSLLCDNVKSHSIILVME